VEEKNRRLPVERSGRKRPTGGSLDGSEPCEGDLFGTKITDVDGGNMKKTSPRLASVALNPVGTGLSFPDAACEGHFIKK